MASELARASTASGHDHDHDHDKVLTALVQANVAKQVENICLSGPVQNVWDAGTKGRKVWVHGLLYEVESGTLKDLGLTRGPAYE